MKAAFSSALVFSAVIGSITAHAQTLVTSGTSEFLSTRNCIAGATSACDSIGGVLNYSEGGVPGQTSSTATQAIPGFGQTSASAALSGVLGSPILTAIATSTSGTREGATAYALQSYTYTGATSIVDTFGGTVTYSQSMTGPYPANIAGTQASVEVFTLPPGTSFDAGMTSDDNFYAMAAAANDNSALFGTPQTGFSLVAASNPGIDDAGTNLSGSGSTTVSVTLNPGETVWVLASLGVYAPNGSSIDPTFTTHWTDSTNLVTGVAAPELDSASAAAGLTLLFGGIAVLVCRPRRPEAA